MSRKILCVALFVSLVTVFGVVMVDAQGPKPGTRSPRANLGTGFTYQGQLKNGGNAVNGTCDFQFGLWSDAAGLSSQIGTTVTVASVSVANGLFTASIDFGGNAFNGDARYLGIAVACPTGGSYTPFTSRQALTPAPMAFALPGLYTQQNATSPNIIGGYSGNSVAADIVGATISGGGYGATNCGYYSNLSCSNQVLVNFGTVGGGDSNTANGIAATIGGGTSNVANGNWDTIGGGRDNTTSNTYSTVPGGESNIAAGSWSFAAGFNARANHAGTFVWSDVSTGPITSTAINQFVISASNGVSLTKDAGGSKIIDVGERYRDNAIIGWGDIGANGTQSGSFGIASVVKTTGIYTITLTAQPANAFTVVPIAIAEIDGPPTSAASARLVTINLISPSQFVVYITNGSYALVDNQFLFMVTGR